MSNEYCQEIQELLKLNAHKNALERINFGKLRLKDRLNDATSETEWKVLKYDDSIYEGEV